MKTVLFHCQCASLALVFHSGTVALSHSLTVSIYVYMYVSIYIGRHSSSRGIDSDSVFTWTHVVVLEPEAQGKLKRDHFASNTGMLHLRASTGTLFSSSSRFLFCCIFPPGVSLCLSSCPCQCWLSESVFQSSISVSVTVFNSVSVSVAALSVSVSGSVCICVSDRHMSARGDFVSVSVCLCVRAGGTGGRGDIIRAKSATKNQNRRASRIRWKYSQVTACYKIATVYDDRADVGEFVVVEIGAEPHHRDTVSPLLRASSVGRKGSALALQSMGASQKYLGSGVNPTKITRKQRRDPLADTMAELGLDHSSLARFGAKSFGPQEELDIAV